ncbi:MAG: hypothetical protein DRZ82_09460 [Thermoprotei archaeon]|nr:MAG: hypothetical protein DRZ82_09460 [Thermoprotei archaeon]
MLRHVIALVFIVLVVLASALYYYYSQHCVNQVTFLISKSVESRTNAPSGEAWYDNVTVRINYTVIDDPETLSIAREFIKASLPLPTCLDKKQLTDWPNVDIAVLKVIMELVNNGNKPIYYITNAFCEVCFNATVCDHRFKPITWRIENPIAVPEIVAEEGHVFPLVILYTLDLRYRKVPPKTSITNEFYYIVTKPFRGIIKAAAAVCPEPFSGECRIIENHTHVYVVNVEYSPHTGMNIVNTFFSNKSFVLNLSAFLYNITVVMSNNMSISIDRNGLLTIYLENRGDRVYEDFSWVLQGYRPIGFPTRFKGTLNPRSKVAIYRAYLLDIFNRTGEYETIIMSSEALMFNIPIYSHEEVLKLKELAPRITPILRIKCDEPRPKVCKASLPKYSLYLRASVRLNPEELGSFQIIKKPRFINVEILRGINQALKLINDSKTRESFIEQWGGKNVTVIALYINNEDNENLTIVDWSGYIIHVVDAHNESTICGYGIITQILKPNIIVVKPKEEKLFSLHIVEYREGELYIDGYECGKVKPGAYIIKMSFRTKPGIYVEVGVKFGFNK